MEVSGGGGSFCLSSHLGAILLLVSGVCHLLIKAQLFPKLDGNEEHIAQLLGIVGPIKLWLCTAKGLLWLLFTGDVNNTLTSHSQCLNNSPTASVALLSQELCVTGYPSGLGDVPQQLKALPSILQAGCEGQHKIRLGTMLINDSQNNLSNR